MKKLFFCFLLLLFSLNALSQQKVLVLDKTTRLPIPNITFWTKGNPISFTTNTKGIFTITQIKKGEIFIKSAIYKDYNSELESLPAIVYLELKKEQKDNVITINRSEVQKTTSSDSVHMTLNALNKISAKWIKNDRARKIASLDLYVRSITKNTTFKIRFFNCDSLQNPSTDFFDKEIIVKTNGTIDVNAEMATKKLFKSYEKITLNLEEYNIITPNENFYIGIELLQLRDNQLKPTKSYNNLSQKALISKSLSPFIGYTKTNYNDTMNFSIANWEISEKSILLHVTYAE